MRTVADALAARSAWWICALCVLAGAAVLDDYGVSIDENRQRQTAQVVLNYVWGRDDDLLRYRDRLYGVAVEVPLLWAERLLGLQDSRAIHLLRHLLTHLLFLAGGLGAAVLAFRLYGRRSLALCALGLFLLHPRLYAHSFFNSKDLPFLSLFMLALLLAHWACRRGTGAAFALCGAGIGVLSNVRPIGLVLLAGVLALRAYDAVAAADRTARRQAWRTGGLCGLACALTLYALWPYLWSDPVRRLAEALAHMAEFPLPVFPLFRGALIDSGAVPPAYAPVWFAITAPPPALLLGLVGLAALAGRVRRRPGMLLRHPRVRFEGVALACCALPVLAVILLGSTLYNGWRHLYFLHAPFCVLANGGLHALATAARRYGRAGWAYGLAGGGAAATLGAMAFLHPHQHLYFNGLVDRATPERLRTRYEMDYWAVTHRQALEFLLAQYPAAPLSIHTRGPGWNRVILPAADRRRVVFSGTGHADFLIIHPHEWMGGGGYAPVIHAQKAYGNTVTAVAAINLARVEDAVAAPYRAAYRALAARTPVIRDRFDVYLDERAVSYVQTPCRPEAQGKFLLHATPADLQDLPPDRRRFGFDNLDFYLEDRGVRFDDVCLAVAPRPGYPVRHLTVGQWRPGASRALWSAEIPVPPALEPDAVNAYRAAHRALAARPPTHRAAFDVYLTASTIAFAKAPCTAADTVSPFIVHAAPVDPRVLSERPFGNLDFSFYARGVRFDDACLASVPRPAWPLRSLTVGQWRSGATHTLWQAEIPVPPAPRAVNVYRAAYRALASATPAHRAAFDVYLAADAVAFAKTPCTAADTQPRFILHVIPIRTRDLPPDRQRVGFDNRDFAFAWQGARFDGACLAYASLPDYPIDRLRVGQFRPGEDPLWLVELPPAS